MAEENVSTTELTTNHNSEIIESSLQDQLNQAVFDHVILEKARTEVDIYEAQRNLKTHNHQVGIVFIMAIFAGFSLVLALFL